VAIFDDLRRWRREHRERRAHRASFGSLPGSLERGAACALVELSRTVGTEDWDTSVRRIVKLDAELLEVDRVNLWSLHEETASIYCEGGYVASLRTYEHGATLFESQLPEYFAAMREARIINMPDVRTDPRCRGLREYCASRSIASMLDVPVWADGSLSGVVCHEHVGAIRRWNAREEDFVTCISQIVSWAIASRARSEADVAAQRASFLDTVSSVLSSLDSLEVAKEAVWLCLPKFAHMAMVWVRSDEGGLECKSAGHVDPTKNGVVLEHCRKRAPEWRRERPGFASRATLQGQSLLIPELNPSVLEGYGFHSSDRAMLLELGLKSAMAVPLVAGGRILGALTLFHGTRAFTTDDLVLAESIASRVAGALWNARLYEIARSAIRARDEILVLAAHELRTPLSALQLTTDQLVQQTRRGQDAAQITRSEKVATQVRRFRGVVDRILEAMSIRAEGVSIHRSPCDLAQTVRDRVARMSPRAQSMGSTITASCPPSLEGTFDCDRAGTVVDALLDNAVKFGRGQPIEVTLVLEGPWAVLAVRDHGIGFSPEGLDAFFDPFERGVAREHFGGLGLGLYVAKAIVDAHGGSIGATSEPGEGATFVVRLPISV
jgi:signal transduction histidine kinase